jgi:type VII secretion integral membrane protein EccD
VGTVTAVPLQTLGAASAVVSLVLIEAAAPVSIILAGLSSHLTSDPDANPDRLNSSAIRANTWLTSVVATFSAAAALGAIGVAAGSCLAGGRSSLGIAFAVVTGGVLLLRARSHRDVTRSAPLVMAGTVTLGAALVIAAVVYPLRTPYLAAVLTMLAVAALCLGFITQTTTFSPIGRRGIDLLEYLGLAMIVPLACWICGIYSAARGMNLP